MEEVTIGSTTEFDRLVAECEIEKKIGIIISDENPGDFQISFYVMPADEDDFACSRKQAFRMIPVEALRRVLAEAVDRLQNLKDR